MILGTGMHELIESVAVEVAVPYAELPHFPRATALSHRGQLVGGRLAGVPVLVMDGRCHRYEGYSFDEITLPIFLMRALGAGLLIASNASGGLNPKFASGDVMVMDGHIDLMFGRRNGWADDGKNVKDGIHHSHDSHHSHQIVSQTAACYDTALIDQALSVARRENFPAHRGVYIAVTGPNYETRAEYRFLRRIGGDAVGMSTVPEAIAARQCGMKVLALSTITNVARPDHPIVTHAEDVVAAAARAAGHVQRIVQAIVAEESGATKAEG